MKRSGNEAHRPKPSVCHGVVTVAQRMKFVANMVTSEGQKAKLYDESISYYCISSLAYRVTTVAQLMTSIAHRGKSAAQRVTAAAYRATSVAQRMIAVAQRMKLTSQSPGQ
jgi:hypothetical protein